MVDLLNGGRVKKRHVSSAAARVLGRVVPALRPALVDVLLRDSLPHDPSAAEAPGFSLRAPSAVYASASGLG